MNTDDVMNRSIFIITQYYENNLTPFFENISDDILWLGPAEHQYIHGKKNLIETFAAEKHALTFTMGDIKAQCISPQNRVKEVLLSYDISTHFPSGANDIHKQRLHYTWRDRRVKGENGWEYHPEIAMIHISNLWHYDRRDTIYPVHYESMYAPIRLNSQPKRYVTVKALNKSVYRLEADHVLYIETIKRSARLLVHTKNETITINGTLPDFERTYPGLFLRIHASYLINPAAVRRICRFSVTLSDGTVLPIPEKKYTRVKKLLMQKDN